MLDGTNDRTTNPMKIPATPKFIYDIMLYVIPTYMIYIPIIINSIPIPVFLYLYLKTIISPQT